MNIDDIDKPICSIKCGLLEYAINSDNNFFRMTHFAMVNHIFRTELDLQ